MIPRSLPPLPPQLPRDVKDLSDIDSSAGTDASRKQPRVRRKHKGQTNSRKKSHQLNDDLAEPEGVGNVEGMYSSDAQNGGSLPASTSSEKNSDSQRNGNLAILNRLKLKEQKLRDAEENFEMNGEASAENAFATTLKEKLPITVSNYLSGNLVSQPVAKMFVEEERGFRAISNISGATIQEQEAICNSQPNQGVQTAVELAVKTEKFFHTFSTFCHGLLAGMALWQCIIVYQLGPPHFETADFINHYSFLSQPMQTLFYFFFVICIISAFDRYDVGNPQCSKCTLACRSGVIVIIIYPISLVLSLSIANFDDKMNLHNYNASIWTSENDSDMQQDLFYWKILNLGRCVGAVVGWIIVALQPNVNSFLHRLEYVGSEMSSKFVTSHYSGPV